MKPKHAIGLAAVTVTVLLLLALVFKLNVSRRPGHFLAKSHENVVDDLVKKRIRSEFSDRETLIRKLQAKGMTYESFRKHVRQEVEANAANH